ncbi:MAG TPA: T9SS type A sorting domain-containing protein [Lacibacter sp.]|nr:T9SS type A sorting domain-containing protein [Lacibacter sp.]
MKRIFTILACILLITTATAQTDRTPAGNAENVVKVVRFYPNPASSFINFEFKETRLADFSFKVFNFIGKKVLEINNLTPRTVVNLNDYFRGVYIFQLTDRNGKVVESGKFQVVK